MRERPVEGRGSRVRGRGYQQLRAWQESHALALRAFSASKSLRPGQRWLADQFARSARSVPANIAEGYSRGSLREYLQFLTIARGSLAETEYYVLFIEDAGLLPAGEIETLSALLDDAGSLLLGLIRSLQAKDGGGRARKIPTTHDPPPVTHDPQPSTRR